MTNSNPAIWSFNFEVATSIGVLPLSFCMLGSAPASNRQIMTSL